MTGVAAADTPAPRRDRIRRVGAVLVTALALLIVLAPPLTAPLREAWFDAYQALSPRVVTAMPAVVVAIDGPSLAAFGRWPWPRSGEGSGWSGRC